MKKKNKWLIESYREFTRAAYAPYKGVRRAGVYFCNALLSLYAAAVALLLCFAKVPLLTAAVICGIISFFVVYQGFKFVMAKFGWGGGTLSAVTAF